MANKLIWGADLYKGFKLDKSTILGATSIGDLLPFQLLSLEEKTIDWIRTVADYYEMVGWSNVERKAPKIQRNFWMRYGKLNPNDYIHNPDVNPYSRVVQTLVPQESQSPLEQFYPLAPNFVDVLRGEFIKRDNTWTIDAIDQFSVSQGFDNKKEQFEQIITDFARVQKEQSLAAMGLTQASNPQEYQNQMNAAMQQLTEVELKSKTFRTTGLKWAEKVLKIQERRYNLDELEPDGFESGLITDSEFWHLDLMEDDFKLELINPKWCDYHKGPNTKYVSDGDYFLWFDFMSVGDIVNRFGRRIKEDDLMKLKDIHIQTSNLMIPDYAKSQQGAYYDMSKPWLEATDLNPVRNDAFLGQELAYSYPKSGNFDHNINVDLLDPVWGNKAVGQPNMFRVMRLYWRSQMRVGWLTKINRDGSRPEPVWVDENYRVTIEPVYDTSVVKDKTKDNLLYGEHIDWTWAPQWRHVMKISPNQKHTFWLNSRNTLESIYIDGGPVPFQFKGRKNPFDSLPPVEGCIYSYINTDSHSFIDRIRGLQIIYNICMNRVPKKFLNDHGMKVAIDRRIMSTNNSFNISKTVDPLEAFEDKLSNSDIFDYTLSREALEGLGQPALPTVLQLSTVADAQMYFHLAQEIKWEAGELIGITRQRAGGQKASDTAYSIQQGINYSETQTEKYFEQHSNLMQRVRQRMLDAAQYYSTFKESSREIYQDENDENVFLEIEGMDNTLSHYNLYLRSRANVRAALQKIQGFLEGENTLPIKPSAKLESMISNSIPKILTLVRDSEFEQEQKEAAQFQAEQQQKTAQMQAEQQAAADNRAHDDQQKELDRQKDVEVATIKAEGGVQTDANKNSIPDAAENLTPYLKQQELQQKARQQQDELSQKRQVDTDKMLLEREKNQTDLEKEKIKAASAKYVADVNKNKYSGK